jgi:phosphatidylethanolamine/phosphatidyl-N-methylethanolamine N-methyltransferase
VSLKFSYTLLAPFYDALIDHPLRAARRRSLQRLPAHGPADILLSGFGTGLDLPWLPPMHHYTAVDLTPAMLARARQRNAALRVEWVLADCQRLPFADASFDCALLHLILAIVPDGRAAIAETARVLRPGGRVYLLDKFLRPGESALLRRWINPLMRRVATRTDVVFEDLLSAAPSLDIIDNQPALWNGWFREITLQKR